MTFLGPKKKPHTRNPVFSDRLLMWCMPRVACDVSLKQKLIPRFVCWCYPGLSRQFSIDKYCLTNEQFAFFVEESGYVTEAEKFGWSFALE